MSASHSTPPNVGEHLLLGFPAPHVLQLTLNRPKQMNSMTTELELDMGRILDWFEETPALWVAIITGRGRAFCAGQDLKSWQDQNKARAAQQKQQQPERSPEGHPLRSREETDEAIARLRKGGFGSVSTRRSSKPIIAAVDGICMGGGMEMLLNCDMAVATTRSRFALPEVCRGVVAAQGGIARLAKISGHHRASELLLTGSAVSASELYSKYLLLNELVPLTPSASLEEGQAAVERAALQLALKLTQNSPDALLVTKETLNQARDYGGVGAPGSGPFPDDGASSVYWRQGDAGNLEDVAAEGYRNTRARALYVGANIQEGLEAFRNKRAPQWKDPIVIDGRKHSKL